MSDTFDLEIRIKHYLAYMYHIVIHKISQTYVIPFQCKINEPTDLYMNLF